MKIIKTIFNKIKQLFCKKENFCCAEKCISKQKLELILIDIDGVIYDFVNHMLKTHFSFAKCTEKDIRDYNIAKSLNISKEEFWKACDRAEGIFCEGELYSWTNELIATCERYSKRIAFCTNPGNNPKHWAEKKKFYDKFFVNSGIPFITTQHKESLSLEGVVLIDDFDKNIRKFNSGLGIAITFPQYWNSNNNDLLLKDRIGYIDCTLDDITMVGFNNYKKFKKEF